MQIYSSIILLSSVYQEVPGSADRSVNVTVNRSCAQQTRECRNGLWSEIEVESYFESQLLTSTLSLSLLTFNSTINFDS